MLPTVNRPLIPDHSKKAPHYPKITFSPPVAIPHARFSKPAPQCWNNILDLVTSQPSSYYLLVISVMYTASSLPKTLMSHSLFALSSPTKLALSIQQLHIPFFPSHMSAIIPTQQTRNQVMKYCISIIFCIMIEIIKLHSLSPPMLALFSKDIKFHSPTQPSSWLTP